MPILDDMGDRPRLRTDAIVHLELFEELNRTRTSNGFGPNPITFSEFQACANLYGIPSGAPRQNIWRVIREVDNASLARAHSDNKDGAGGNAAGGTPPKDRRLRG